eukprot:633301-Hanusia_phi.AAC.1
MIHEFYRSCGCARHLVVVLSCKEVFDSIASQPSSASSPHTSQPQILERPRRRDDQWHGRVVRTMTLFAVEANNEPLPLFVLCHATSFCKEPFVDELQKFSREPFRWAALTRLPCQVGAGGSPSISLAMAIREQMQ